MPRKLETPEDYGRKRTVDLASYHRMKQDPEWLARRRERDRIAKKRAYRPLTGEELLRRKRARRAKYLEIRTEALAVYGGRCQDCGFPDHRALQFDHVDRGGHAHRKSTSGATILRHVRDHPELYRLLCANCHAIKTRAELEKDWELP